MRYRGVPALLGEEQVKKLGLGADTILIPSVKDRVELVDCHPQISSRRDHQKCEWFFEEANGNCYARFLKNVAHQPGTHERTNS